MKKTIFILMFLLMVSIVVAYNPIVVTRTVPTETNPESSFIVSYYFDISDNERMSVMFTEIVTGGCTPSSKDIYVASTLDGIERRTYTAPSSTGSCTFEGYYEYADGVDPFNRVDPESQTITITGGCIDTCASKGWECGTVCGTSCGTCSSGQTCDNGQCVSTEEEEEEEQIPTEKECIPFIQDKVNGECKFNNIAKIALIFIIFLIVFKYFK